VASVPGLIFRPANVSGALIVTLLYLGLFAAGLFVLKPLTSADAALAARFSRRAGIVVERLAGTQKAD
jgi:hypothetical protein